MKRETNKSGRSGASERVPWGGTYPLVAPTPVLREARARPSLRRKLLIRLMFLLASVVFAVVLVEIIGRILLRSIADDAEYYPRLESFVLRSAPILEPTRKPGTIDARFGYVLSPGVTHTETRGGITWTVHTNSLGFRSREIEPRLPGEYRVLLVGDSYFEGTLLNDDETLGVQIERMSGSDPDVKRPVRVYNLARSGSSRRMTCSPTRSRGSTIRVTSPPWPRGSSGSATISGRSWGRGATA
jgi:hypothetical protein